MKKSDYIFYDRLKICDKSLNKTNEGYLQLQGIIARSGQQSYLRKELGLTDGLPDDIIVLNRPSDEVTSPLTIASFLYKPITDNHPQHGNVDASNTPQFMKGIVTNIEATPGQQLKADLLITDEKLVKSIERGKRELSAGYSAKLDFSDDGKTAVQRKIRGNHIAFVDKARCGHECSIFDSNKLKELSNMAKLKINGVEIEIQDSAVPMVQQVIQNNEALALEIVVLKDQNSASEAKIDVANEKIKELEDSKLTDSNVLALAEEMTELWTHVKLIDKDYSCKGKSSAQIKTDIVLAQVGDAMKDKDVAYIAARFDVLVEDAKTKGKDPLTHSLKDANKGDIPIDVTNIADEARNRKIQRYQMKSVGDSGSGTDHSAA